MDKKASKKWVIGLAAVIILVAVFLFTRGGNKSEAGTQDIHTEKVETRDLVKSVGSTGTVVSKNKKEISVNLSGVEVDEVKAEVGDFVKKGDLLLTFDVENVRKDLENAKKSLSNAEKRNSITERDADRSVKNAEETRNYQIEGAKDTMNSAKKEYEILKKEYNKALKELESLRKKKKNAESSSEQGTESAAMPGQDTQTADGTLESQITAQEETVKNLKKQMDTAKRTYQTAKKNYEYTKKAQESTVNTAKSSAVSSRYSSDTSSQETQIRQYEEQLAKEKLYAPFDGIVTAVNYEKGDVYTGGTLLTVQDCSEYEIEVSIGEYDISDIKEGQKVLIKTDATGETEILGKVRKILPVSENSGSAKSSDMGNASSDMMASSGTGGSDISYPVTISIDKPNERLKLDMSATVSIILEEHAGVLAVPYNAVQTGEKGDTFVTVVDGNGKEENVEITVVMESNYYTEITSDSLSEGTKVKVMEEEESTNPFDSMPAQGGGF